MTYPPQVQAAWQEALALPAPRISAWKRLVAAWRRIYWRKRRSLPLLAPKLLTLYGDPQAGKDLLAEHLDRHYTGITIFAWSDLIMEDLNRNFPVKITQATKAHLPYRRLLQEWAMMRRREDPDYWIKRTEAKLQGLKDQRLVIITGSRDPRELLMIRKHKGVIWKIIRPGSTYRAPHEAENMLRDWTDVDAVIANDDEGNVQSFYNNIEIALQGVEDAV